MIVNAYRSKLGQTGYVAVVAEGGQYLCDGRKVFENVDTVVDFCRRQLKIDEMAEEHVEVLAMDAKNHLQGVFEVSVGAVNAAIVPVREIFQKLLALNAVGFIVVHNHPSGDAVPSDEDNAITKKLYEASKIMDVTMIDHVIVGNYGGQYSYRASGVVINEQRLVK